MNACSRIGKRVRPGWGLCWAVSLLAGWALVWSGEIRAQATSSPTVVAKITGSVVDVGEAIQYQITVNDGRADVPPTAPAVDGLTIKYLGAQPQNGYYYDSRVGGHFVNAIVYVYSVVANRPGRYILPGQQVMVAGSALRVPPVAFTAESDNDGGTTPPGQQISSELIIPKKSAYVGESIPAEVRSYFGAEVRRQPDPEAQITGEGFSVQKFSPPRSSEQIIDGLHYNVITYKTAVAGLKTGTLTIGPAETNPVVQLPVVTTRHHRQNYPYNSLDSLLGGAILQPPRQIKMSTEPVTLEIKPLPAGKPADFSGGIGQFKLDVEAEPRRAQAGDPVTVRLILSGQGNFERIGPPVLADERGLKTYPPTSKFKADDDVGLSGVKTFEQVVIADGARGTLPPYRFSYLDPGTGKYVSLDTPPVAVRIEGSAVTPAPVVSSVAPAISAPTATPTPTPPPRAAEDILYIRADPSAVRDRDAFLPVYQRRGFWLAQGVPLAGLLAALAGLGLRARARNDAARQQARLQREQGELQRALRKEDASRRDFYGAATRLAQLRAARGRTDVPLTAAEISQARRLDPQTAHSVQEIFYRHDELAYSGGQVAQEPVPTDERRGVLATLETLGKNGK